MAFKMKGSPMQRNFGLNTPMQGKKYAPGQLAAIHASKAEKSKKTSNKMLGDLDKNGELSGYEKNRQEAIEENMKKSKDKSPLEQQKKTNFGPREKIECPGDMMYHEPTGSCMSVEAYEDAMGVGKGSNRKVMKSDKATEKKLKEIEKKKSKMSKEELERLQKIADDKSDRFHKRGKYAVKKKK